MVKVELLPQPGVVVMTLWDTVTAEELQNAFQQLPALPGWFVTMPMIADCRRVTRDLAAAAMADVAAAIPRVPDERPEGHVALVVARDIDFGNARAFAGWYGERLRLRYHVVRTWSDGVRALGFETEQLPDPGSAQN